MSLFYLSIFSSLAYFHIAFGAKQFYDIRLVKIFDCSYPTDNISTRISVDVKYINKTSFVLNGDYSIVEKLDNNVVLHVSADLKSKGEYKEKLFDNELGPLCDGMKKLSPSFFAQLLGNGDTEKMCPIHKGQYSVDSEPMTIELPNVKTLPFGAYRVKFEGHRGPCKVFCLAVFADVTKPR
ncbi:uncharacterized protein LOC106662456 [Cimex lectularius]|uniref:MD-2-related lipid-recognition domain-containing protein n=1 Tax=Cimex lectularius TaxID=79782 RepID=A0A8I6RDY6_CIMLE|nr:uncharacterized protein LOC106662456 [Cimex lectularius]